MSGTKIIFVIGEWIETYGIQCPHCTSKEGSPTLCTRIGVSEQRQRMTVAYATVCPFCVTSDMQQTDVFTTEQEGDLVLCWRCCRLWDISGMCTVCSAFFCTQVRSTEQQETIEQQEMMEEPAIADSTS